MKVLRLMCLTRHHFITLRPCCSAPFPQEEVDSGAIIAQEAVPVEASDTEETLSERIRQAEHKAFPIAMELVASGAVCLGPDGRIVWKHSARN